MANEVLKAKLTRRLKSRKFINRAALYFYTDRKAMQAYIGNYLTLIERINNGDKVYLWQGEWDRFYPDYKAAINRAMIYGKPQIIKARKPMEEPEKGFVWCSFIVGNNEEWRECPKTKWNPDTGHFEPIKTAIKKPSPIAELKARIAQLEEENNNILQSTKKERALIEDAERSKEQVKYLLEGAPFELRKSFMYDFYGDVLQAPEQSAISTQTNAPQEAPADEVDVVRTTEPTTNDGISVPTSGVTITEGHKLIIQFPFAEYKTLDEMKKTWLKKNFQYNPYNKSWKAKRNSVTKQALLIALAM